MFLHISITFTKRNNFDEVQNRWITQWRDIQHLLSEKNVSWRPALYSRLMCRSSTQTPTAIRSLASPSSRVLDLSIDSPWLFVFSAPPLPIRDDKEIEFLRSGTYQIISIFLKRKGCKWKIVCFRNRRPTSLSVKAQASKHAFNLIKSTAIFFESKASQSLMAVRESFLSWFATKAEKLRKCLYCWSGNVAERNQKAFS